MRFLPIGDTDAEIAYYLTGYKKLKKYFRFWDMEGEEQEFIFQIVAAILLLGQIRFGDESGQSFITNPDILNKGDFVILQPCRIKIDQPKFVNSCKSLER